MSTPARLGSSVAQVFTGLYVSQQRQLGRSGVSAAALHTQGSCHRTGSAQQGPGEDWVCLVQYVDASVLAAQSFEVQAKPDGCWAAAASPLAEPALTPDPRTGRLAVNQLAGFDGCLDTSWR